MTIYSVEQYYKQLSVYASHNMLFSCNSTVFLNLYQGKFWCYYRMIFNKSFSYFISQNVIDSNQGRN